MESTALANPLDPSYMSPTERIADLGRFLAAGFIRMKASKSSPISADGGETSVDFTPPKSGHATRNSGGTTR